MLDIYMILRCSRTLLGHSPPTFTPFDGMNLCILLVLYGIVSKDILSPYFVWVVWCIYPLYLDGNGAYRYTALHTHVRSQYLQRKWSQPQSSGIVQWSSQSIAFSFMLDIWPFVPQTRRSSPSWIGLACHLYSVLCIILGASPAAFRFSTFNVNYRKPASPRSRAPDFHFIKSKTHSSA